MVHRRKGQNATNAIRRLGTVLRRTIIGPRSIEKIALTSKMIEQTWPLTDVRIGPVLQQHSNRLVQGILAAEGRFVFKIAGHYCSERDFAKAIYIFEFLRLHKFENVPALLKTYDEHSYTSIFGNFAYVMEYIDGSDLEETEQNWCTLGHIVGKLHNISGFPRKTSYTTEAVFQELYDNARKLPFGCDYMNLVNALPSFEGLSQSLLHTDVGPNNIIQKEDGGLVLIDWDDPGRGTTIIDLGFPLILHFLRYGDSFEKENALAFYNGYFQERSLPPKERPMIFDAGLLCALAYLPSGDVEKNWLRVLFAANNRELLSSVLG